MVLIITQILGGNLGKSNVGFRHLNLTYKISYKLGDRINKNPKNQIITVNNNQFSALLQERSHLLTSP
ncbi:hypothetical protein MICAC_3470006 [Microcystis aeruginosa PCC 9443]|uniref:Uncharacterized protein n=1 Tax=Microcystis aeruginosa PCC 9443 TaxID=1160281 RepID=I4G3N9_MICAE|nr:hypothetical protein MICAC_3470006 [Microcystis aeruginosa PCC 9443]